MRDFGILIVLVMSGVLAAAPSGTLTIYPESVELFGEGARQHLIVTFTDATGIAHDVTAIAHLASSAAGIAQVDNGGLVHAVAGGTTQLTASYEGLAAHSTIAVRAAGGSRDLSFVKDIVPIFTKFGCAGSNCHGSIRGKAGFKLSLFGYEPSLDYEAIVKGSEGRRVNLDTPAESLILRKPTFQMPHGGGVRFEKDSLPYNGILEWLRAGAKYDSAGSPRLASLAVYPAERWMVGLGTTQQLVVTGRYTDGSVEDLTDKVQFSSNDEAIMDVTRSGLVKTVAAGESTVMVRTLGQAIAARIFVVNSPAGPGYPAIQANNYIDGFIFEHCGAPMCFRPARLATPIFCEGRTWMCSACCPRRKRQQLISIPGIPPNGRSSSTSCWIARSAPMPGPPTLPTCSAWVSMRAVTRAPRSSTTGSGRRCWMTSPTTRWLPSY